MEKNIEKLKARYPEGFDKARSINRNDERTHTLEEVKTELGLDDGTEEKVHRKTYLEDYIEKHPKAPVDSIPRSECVEWEYHVETNCIRDGGNSCEVCWNRVMPEEE